MSSSTYTTYCSAREAVCLIVVFVPENTLYILIVSVNVRVYHLPSTMGDVFLRDIDYLFILFCKFLFFNTDYDDKDMDINAMCEEVARSGVYNNFFCACVLELWLGQTSQISRHLEEDDVNVDNDDEDDKTRNEKAVHSTRS